MKILELPCCDEELQCGFQKVGLGLAFLNAIKIVSSRTKYYGIRDSTMCERSGAIVGGSESARIYRDLGRRTACTRAWRMCGQSVHVGGSVGGGQCGSLH